ncbi:hypothetical protein [Flavobacterium sp. 3HN19-14]|uniref:hypothetical protein n=1 Tax=Flavobacterium sp. 3HN19-14 TaxID=3448133 RepID=UPI003EE0D964
MKALYVLGTGSMYNNQELRYSLRSLERYGSGIDTVVIIGERPAFLNYDVVEHYPFAETGNKDFRIASKILFACENQIVTGDFLFLNDDFFFRDHFNAIDYPYYQKVPLLNGEPKTPYQKQLAVTRDYLLSQGKHALHFDVHTPIVYNAEKFIALRETWLHSATTLGLVVKSSYCNMHSLYGPIYKDVKLKSLATIDDKIKFESSHVFTINDAHWNNDRAWHLGVEQYLKSEFPHKSKFEL